VLYVNFFELRLFQGIDKVFLDKIFEDSILKKSKAKSKIFDEDALEDPCIFLLKSGIIIVSKTNHFGHETSVDIKYPDDIFGWASFIDNGPRAGTATTVVDSEYWIINSSNTSLLFKNITFNQNLMIYLTRYIRISEEYISNALNNRADEKVLFQLLRLGVKVDMYTTFINNKINQAIIASFAGTSRETVSRALGQLKKLGILKYDQDKNLIINSVEAKKLLNRGLM
jgi:CRP/FNR family transcriptional regulator, cyclic AMP receptor protein